jgi:hypothetical protein
VRRQDLVVGRVRHFVHFGVVQQHQHGGVVRRLQLLATAIVVPRFFVVEASCRLLWSIAAKARIVWLVMLLLLLLMMMMMNGR